MEGESHQKKEDGTVEEGMESLNMVGEEGRTEVEDMREEMEEMDEMDEMEDVFGWKVVIEAEELIEVMETFAAICMNAMKLTPHPGEAQMTLDTDCQDPHQMHHRLRDLCHQEDPLSLLDRQEYRTLMMKSLKMLDPGQLCLRMLRTKSGGN